MSRVRFIFDHLGNYKLPLLILLFVTIIYAGINLIPNLVISFLIDNVINGEEVNSFVPQILDSILNGTAYIKENIWIIAVLLVFIYLLVALFMNIRQRLQGEIAENLCEGIRNDLYSHIQLLPYSYHVKVKTGELIQKCTSDVDMVRRFFSGQFAEIFYILSTALIALIVVININAKLSLFMMISLVIIFIYSYIFFKQVQKQFRLSDEEEAVLSTVIQESLSGIRVIKAFNRELYEIERFAKENKKYQDVTLKMIHYLGGYWSSSYVICLFGILLVVVMGVFEVRAGTLSVGNLTVFISYQTTVLYSMRQLGRILSDFGKLTVSIDRLDGILKEEAEDINDGIETDLKGDIVFDHVSFEYDDDHRKVLDDINMTIKKDETIAIIGPTGSGKSTLVSLLSRLYEPTSGKITISGVDIRDIKKGYLRDNVGIILQEPFLFSRSIMDNLKIVDDRASEEEVYEATRLAAVHDVITEFDRGYKTLVGEKGVTLSGGQKQRIAIARTLMKKTPILIFDDSLSAVDTETDATIRAAIRSLSGNMTTIIITQRVASAKDCDRIFVLEDGKITDSGTHDELINREGLYKRIDEIQSQIVLDEEVR